MTPLFVAMGLVAALIQGFLWCCIKVADWTLWLLGERK